MADPTYRKGHFAATVFTEVFDDGRYQGVVSLERDGDGANATIHRAEGLTTSRAEAFDEAHALAHRLLAGVEER